ncbi:MAG: Crp/Fnr family transcriptional regulator [Proteobacteria bacterium]|nr:Crp/Fnr family transcriptional regulator [Pseudomonadota bacterium]
MPTELSASPQSLSSADLFAGASASTLKIAAASARWRRVPNGKRIFRQGDEDARAHVVVAGGVRISQTGSDGAQVVMRFICAGEMFGTVALFTDRKYPADATAIVDTIEASWREADLLDLMTRFPQIAINAIRIVGWRLQEMQNRARELATRSAEQRIAQALIRLGQQSGRSTPAGTTILLPLRRKDIADISGTTLFTASRILTGWARAGLVTDQRRRLTIADHAGLQQVAEQS